jgi:hypothetical protein
MRDYKTRIPEAVEAYIAAVENEDIVSCNEQKRLVEYVRKTFETEELYVDYDKIEKYFAFQQYFEWNLLPWEKFLVIILLCVYTKDKKLPRWSELFVL